jgi:hypothetical protein
VGLIVSLLLLSPAQVNPRFYRTHFLVVLGLLAVTAIFLRQTADLMLGTVLAGGLLLAFLGSVIWSLAGAPGGRTIIVLSVPVLAAALVLIEKDPTTGSALQPSTFLFHSLLSAAVLGTATTAMLLGHSYLIAPGMSIQPLLRLLTALGVSLLLRLAVAGWVLLRWTDTHSLTNLNDEAVLWLPVRWGLGLIGPLVLTGMAWQTARIRSTQSATGILYVVVIFCFLGELTGLLLLSTTGYAL